jgi:hypothetical protein
MSDQTDEHLNEVALAQLTWKPSVIRNVACDIVTAAVALHPLHVWPDKVNLAGVADSDKNCVGSAWRLLAKAKVIEHTTSFRRSEADGARGRTVFAYRLTSLTRAQTFLERNGVKYQPPGQLKQGGLL